MQVVHPAGLFAASRRTTSVLFGLVIGLAACQPADQLLNANETMVTGSDYAFQLPDSLPAGRAVIRFTNAGKVAHEMGMALLKPGVTLTQVLERVGAGGSPDSLLDGIVGILIAAPGVSTIGGLSVDLLPGRTYALFCNFQDAPDKPPHSALGMVSSRTVLMAP